MKRLLEIKATYDWFFAHYSAEIKDLTQRNDLAGIEKMDARRDVLERGIFVLMFGQFETAVSDAFDKALSARASNPDWKFRRGWDMDIFKSKKIGFETKLAMVLDSQSPSFREIKTAYQQRNHCAHGGMTNAVASINALIGDLYRWESELRS